MLEMTNVVRTERERVDVRRVPGVALRDGWSAARGGVRSSEPGRLSRMRRGVRSWIRRLLQAGR